MKDLLDKLLRFIPGYVENLIGLVGGPKRYVAAAYSRDELSLEKGLTFFALSFAIGWIIRAPLLRLDPLVELGSDATFSLAMVLAYGAALCIAWRVVGGKGPFKQFFVVHLHFAGVLLLISAITYLTIMGSLRAIDPSLYKELTDAVYGGSFPRLVVEDADRLFAAPAFRLAEALLFAGILAGSVWMITGWGAYRKLSGLTRLRSAAAAVLFVVLSIPISAIVFMIANMLIK